MKSEGEFDAGVIELEELMALEDPKEICFLQPWLRESSITLISGRRGVGKSWFALAILGAVAQGEGFGPWEAGKGTESAPTLYLDGEMYWTDVKERFRLLGLGKSASPIYLHSRAYSGQKREAFHDLTTENSRRKLTRILLHRGVRLFVIDNVASLTPGIDENDKAAWDPINIWLLELRSECIASVLVHHQGKKRDQRGTSAREDVIDSSISLNHPVG